MRFPRPATERPGCWATAPDGKATGTAVVMAGPPVRWSGRGLGQPAQRAVPACCVPVNLMDSTLVAPWKALSAAVGSDSLSSRWSLPRRVRLLSVLGRVVLPMAAPVERLVGGPEQEEDGAPPGPAARPAAQQDETASCRALIRSEASRPQGGGGGPSLVGA